MVLVTGGSGLIGEELIRQLLLTGTRVRAIYNRSAIALPQHPDLELVQCDILDVISLAEVMEGIEQVYHCAALIAFLPADVPGLFKVNVEGTANIVNAALEAGVIKLLYVSSVAALGRPADPSHFIDETMDFQERKNSSKYGESKFLGEMEVWRGVAEGLPALVVNPSLVLGAGDWNMGSTRIFKSVYEEFPWYSAGITGYVDVRDVARAMILLMNNGLPSQRYIINAVNASFKEVFDMIADGFGKKRPSKKVTPWMAAMIWRWESLKYAITGKAPLITRETATTALSTQKFDNRKILAALPGFSFRPLSETIAETCKSLQQKLNKQ